MATTNGCRMAAGGRSLPIATSLVSEFTFLLLLAMLHGCIRAGWNPTYDAFLLSVLDQTAYRVMRYDWQRLADAFSAARLPEFSAGQCRDRAKKLLAADVTESASDAEILVAYAGTRTGDWRTIATIVGIPEAQAREKFTALASADPAVHSALVRAARKVWLAPREPCESPHMRLWLGNPPTLRMFVFMQPAAPGEVRSQAPLRASLLRIWLR